jgi:hypothetical protein
VSAGVHMGDHVQPAVVTHLLVIASPRNEGVAIQLA